ncbi:MAG: cysteine peptidase family C39 domain-containing protein [Candidatus Azambacteria bacterium]|nr:cysteine peptidase family C39 domain-containing protein [Candidatus Azambacteria bacterium]
MLKVKPFKQKTSFCGPASLKMVVGYYGLRIQERRIGKLAGCSVAHGTPAKGLLDAAKELGFRGIIKNSADLKDIKEYVEKKKMPVIVQWFSVDEGHYSVVVGIDSENIYLQDPEVGYMKSLRVETFKRVWFDFPDTYLRTRADLVLRRMIVIFPSKEFSSKKIAHKTVRVKK